MLCDVWLVATKDLQIEWRSRVTFSQVVPFAGLVLVLFGFALDANRPVLLQATSGLFWVTIMFVSTLAVQRSTSIETTDGARRALLLAGIEPAAVFVGKSIAVAVQLLVVRQLEGLATAGRRVVLLVDALDEAEERGNNPVVRLLQKLGKARTGAVKCLTCIMFDITVRSCIFCFAHLVPFANFCSAIHRLAFRCGDDAVGARVELAHPAKRVRGG